MFERLRVNIKTLREILRLVWTEAGRAVKARLLAVLILVMTASVLTALGPVALSLLVDRFSEHPRGPAVSVSTLIVLYVLAQWLARSAGEIRGFIYARAERRMFRTLSERLFAHVMHLPLRFHLNRQTGGISQTLDNGLQGYQLVLHHLVFTLLPVAAQLTTVVLVLSRLHHPAFLLFFCGALICYAATFSYAAITTSKAAKSASAAHVDANAAMTDSLLNYEAVKYFTAEAIVQDRVRRALLRTEKEWVGFYQRYASNGLTIATVFAAFLGGAILYATRQVQNGSMSVGDFVLVNSYMLQLMQPVEMLGFAVQGISQGTAMLQQMVALFHEKPECSVAEQSQAADENIRGLCGPGQLEFVNVSLSYSPERLILSDVSFKVPAGKTLGIVGASGAGKSTVVRLLARLLEPDHGHILLDGVRISELPLRELRARIAVVPQDPILFNDTIGYNIAFGKFGSEQTQIEHAATVAHLHDFIIGLPEAYDTKVGERGVRLSGGEKQRLSIARAALKRPRIYVFDEATSSLDSHSEREILRNLQEISRSTTTLIIAHRLSTVVHADEIVVLDRGTIVERGTHETLLRQEGRYAMLWRAQQQGSVAA